MNEGIVHTLFTVDPLWSTNIHSKWKILKNKLWQNDVMIFHLIITGHYFMYSKYLDENNTDVLNLPHPSDSVNEKEYKMFLTIRSGDCATFPIHNPINSRSLFLPLDPVTRITVFFVRQWDENLNFKNINFHLNKKYCRAKFGCSDSVERNWASRLYRSNLNF